MYAPSLTPSLDVYDQEACFGRSLETLQSTEAQFCTAVHAVQALEAGSPPCDQQPAWPSKELQPWMSKELQFQRIAILAPC